MKKRVICIFLVFNLFILNCNVNKAIGEEVPPMKFIDNILNSCAIRYFLLKHGIIIGDEEAYNYANAFLELALKKDVTAMKELFAPNAISEIGENQLDEMLEEFVDYFQADSFTLKKNIGASTSERWDHGKKSKELEWPLEIITGENDYRLAIKCVAYDDWDNDNVGIWSIYIIEKSEDTDLEHPYIGDKKYRTGIYINVKRPE